MSKKMDKGYTLGQLKSLTKDELLEFAKGHDVSGRSTMNKDQLAEALIKISIANSEVKQEKHDSKSKATKNTNEFVKNINGTSKEPYSGSDWLAKYRKLTGSTAANCAHNGCDRDAKVGAHVQKKDNRKSDHWYIIPLCSKCNSASNTEMEINANTVFALVSDVKEVKL
jgi:hypothetical protein